MRDNADGNADGYQSQWQHFPIPGLYTGSAQEGSNSPSPAQADEGLVNAGNVIRSGGSDVPVGIDGDEGCRASNPTCNDEQLLRDNDINGGYSLGSRRG
ncbi:MAG: hypothetical protein QOF73_3436 [Thermomicrobiales bacterium]|nr:hypothetical protein [Thermomicrobiales bacterium]